MIISYMKSCSKSKGEELRPTLLGAYIKPQSFIFKTQASTRNGLRGTFAIYEIIMKWYFKSNKNINTVDL